MSQNAPKRNILMNRDDEYGSISTGWSFVEKTSVMQDPNPKWAQKMQTYLPLIEPTATEAKYTRSVSDIPRADIPPTNQTYSCRGLLHQVSITHNQDRCTPLLIRTTATEPYYARALWHVEQCRHTHLRCTWSIGNLTYSDIGCSVNTCIMQDPERRQTMPQKHISWMNNRQVTQITCAALYKHEDYFQSRLIY